MGAAKRTGVKPLIAFTRNWRPSGQFRLPPMKEYRKSFRAFRARYPHVSDFSAWNEANHTAPADGEQAARRRSLLQRDAHGAAAPARSSPPTCSTAATWSAGSRRFKRYAPEGAHLGPAQLQGRQRRDERPRAAPAGRARQGLADRDRRHPAAEAAARAAAATAAGSRTPRRLAAVKRVYQIARASRRDHADLLLRVAGAARDRWDSAFLNADGTQRPAYRRAQARLLGV